ncbi:MAG: hypothetical protein COA79_05355 [Planctomycetota bacterium]|nr:MAG: hypothetical protein COA79_05355 [Planctomycetota bacterium]
METNTTINFHFDLKDENENLLDTSRNSDQTISFLVGENQLKPKKLENKIDISKVGEIQNIYLTAKDAYGERDEKKIQIVPINEIKLEEENQIIERGQKVKLISIDKESAENLSTDITFVISEVMNGMVALDNNHPLAGLNLNYDIEIISVETEEIE